jgi:ribosome maturation factor RimP
MDAKTIARVRELAEPIISEQNLELVDIKYVHENRRWFLRITIDKEDGVTLRDCTNVSKEVGYALEIKDVIAHPFHLEVSSPGLERPLKTLRDFEKCLGRTVKIITTEPLEGQNHFRGTIQSVHDGTVYIDSEGKGWSISLKTIDRAQTVFEFPKKGQGGLVGPKVIGEKDNHGR